MKRSKVFMRCTFDEMVSNNILDHVIGGANKTNGFSIGKRGKAKFWMFDPTPNGFYRLYQQNESGEIISIRYIDGSKTIVTIWER